MANDNDDIREELEQISKSLASLKKKVRNSVAVANGAELDAKSKLGALSQLKNHIQKRDLPGILSILGGWRYRKIIKVLPGVHLNLTRQGVSVTLGKHPLSVNIGKRGVFANEDIPGTHLWRRQRLFNNANSVENANLVPRPTPVPKNDIGMHGDIQTAGKARRGSAMQKWAKEKKASKTPPTLPGQEPPPLPNLPKQRVLSPEQRANRLERNKQEQNLLDQRFEDMFRPNILHPKNVGPPMTPIQAAIEKGKENRAGKTPQQLQNLDRSGLLPGLQILPKNDKINQIKTPFLMPKYAGPMASLNDFKSKPPGLPKNASVDTVKAIKDLKSEIVKEHKEDHKYDETAAAKAEEKRIKDDEFQAALLAGINKEKGSSGLVPKMHDSKGHPILAEAGRILGHGLEDRLLIKALAPAAGVAAKPAAKASGGLIKSLMSRVGLGTKAALPEVEGAAEGAGLATEGAEGAAVAGGSIIGKLTGPILGLAVNGILGFFKANKWGTSGSSAALGGALGGVFDNKLLNVFAQMGQFAMAGAAAGSVIPGLGTLAGGILGAAVGAVTGIIGGENIANFAEKTGLGKFVESNLSMVWAVVKRGYKEALRPFKVILLGLKFIERAFKNIAGPLEPIIKFYDTKIGPIIKPLFDITKNYFDMWSQAFGWIEKLVDSNDGMDDTIDKLLTDDKLFEKVFVSFKKGIAELAAGLLEKVPFLLDPGGIAHATATTIRKEAGIETGATSAPQSPASKPASANSPEQSTTQKVTNTIGKSKVLNTISTGLFGINFAGDTKTTPHIVSTPNTQSSSPATQTPTQTSGVPKLVTPEQPITQAKGVLDGFVSSGDPAKDAMMKAIAQMEGNGYKNNNPGNVWDPVASKQRGKFTLRTFPTMQDGWKYLSDLLDGKHGPKYLADPKNSFFDIFNAFAPKGHGKNDPDKYAQFVAGKLGVDPYKSASRQLMTLRKSTGQEQTAKSTPDVSTPQPVASIVPRALGAQLIPSPTAKISSGVSTSGITPGQPNMRIQPPTDGKFLINAERANADLKSDSGSKSDPSNIIVSPSSTTVSSNTTISTQTNPRNTDTTFRDSRFRTGYQT